MAKERSPLNHLICYDWEKEILILNIMNALKYQTTIKNGQLDLPSLDLPEGTIVEAIILIPETINYEDTNYLLSTQTNRQHLQEALELLRNPDNYIYVDPNDL